MNPFDVRAGVRVRKRDGTIADATWNHCGNINRNSILVCWHCCNISFQHLKYDKEMMDAKNNLTCDEPEEIPSPKLTDWVKSSTPWRSPIRHGSMMMPSTPLASLFDSADFTLKQDYDDLF